MFSCLCTIDLSAYVNCINILYADVSLRGFCNFPAVSVYHSLCTHIYRSAEIMICIILDIICCYEKRAGEGDVAGVSEAAWGYVT